MVEEKRFKVWVQIFREEEEKMKDDINEKGFILDEKFEDTFYPLKGEKEEYEEPTKEEIEKLKKDLGVLEEKR